MPNPKKSKISVAKGIMASNGNELQIVKQKQVELERAIIASGEVKLLAKEMNANNLMADNDRDDICMASGTDSPMRIVTILRNKVDINSSNLNKFMDILRREPYRFSDILNVLERKGDSAPYYNK